MLIGCIADDFTGASDIANILSRAGMRTRLFFSPIEGECAPSADEYDAAVVALKSRSIPPAEAVDQSLAALRWLQSSGARQIVFKYCSTFDSTKMGNIGPVAEALAEALECSGVAVCPSFPENGRTVYQGHLFVGDQLLNESGMQDHPVTPMIDADIRRWLQHQCQTTVGHIALKTVQEGASEITSALRSLGEQGNRLVVVDAIYDSDILAIGSALRDMPLVTGGSAIAMGLPANFDTDELHGEFSRNVFGRSGPGLILSGSCSRMTVRQVERYRQSAPSFAVDVERLMQDVDIVESARDFIASHIGANPLVYSTGSPEEVRRMHSQFGNAEVSRKTEAFFGAIASQAQALGYNRIVVAGGETSGAVVQALELTSLDIGLEICPGVPGLYADAEQGGTALALKSGNFGEEDFFAYALRKLEA